MPMKDNEAQKIANRKARAKERQELKDFRSQVPNVLAMITELRELREFKLRVEQSNG